MVQDLCWLVPLLMILMDLVPEHWAAFCFGYVDYQPRIQDN